MTGHLTGLIPTTRRAPVEVLCSVFEVPIELGTSQKLLDRCSSAIEPHTAAFYGGTAFGAHRLAPAVSPKKSVEGAVASAATALFLGLVLPLPHSAGTSLGLGVALDVAAQTGDLAESLLKRCAGVKDSGSLFPGHGGVLDRVDSFLLALPLYASCLQLTAG